MKGIADLRKLLRTGKAKQWTVYPTPNKESFSGLVVVYHPSVLAPEPVRDPERRSKVLCLLVPGTPAQWDKNTVEAVAKYMRACLSTIRLWAIEEIPLVPPQRTPSERAGGYL